MWRGTALSMIVEAADEEKAWRKAAREVKRNLGGECCLELKVLGEVK